MSDHDIQVTIRVEDVDVMKHQVLGANRVIFGIGPDISIVATRDGLEALWRAMSVARHDLAREACPQGDQAAWDRFMSVENGEIVV